MKIKLLVSALAMAGLSFVAQATEFKSADTHNADDYPTVVAVKHMSEVLEKLSGGKHKIKVFNKAALGQEKETIDQVKIGALDLTRVNVGPMNGICPLTQVPTMPFLFSSVNHMRKSLDGAAGEEILKSCEAFGFVGLAFYDSGARSIYAKKPIKTVADAKGLKIRVQQSDLWVALVSAMGANATPMPYGEVYTGILCQYEGQMYGYANDGDAVEVVIPKEASAAAPYAISLVKGGPTPTQVSYG